MLTREFVAKVYPVVCEALPATSEEARRLLLAHAALESSWGDAKAFRLGRNLFNATRGPNDHLPIVESEEPGWSPRGGLERVIRRFAYYDTLAACIDHYLQVINRPRFQPALAQLLDGDITFITTLGAGGYYDTPADQYRRRFLSTLAAVEAVLESSPPS